MGLVVAGGAEDQLADEFTVDGEDSDVTAGDQDGDGLALVPAVVGLLAYSAGADRVAGTSLAFGASTKVFPGLFIPPLAVMRWCSGDRRGATRLTVWAIGTTVVLNGPIALIDPSGWWYPAAFQGRRDATWGTLWFWLFRVPGAQGLLGGDPARLANVVAAITLVGSLIVIAVLAVRRHLDAVAVGAAVTAAFLLTNKVYSPNYDFWIVPFFVLVYGRFHGLWEVGTVRVMLPVFIVLRACSLGFLVVTALRSRGPAPRTPDESVSPGVLARE